VSYPYISIVDLLVLIYENCSARPRIGSVRFEFEPEAVAGAREEGRRRWELGGGARRRDAMAPPPSAGGCVGDGGGPQVELGLGFLGLWWLQAPVSAPAIEAWGSARR
jgi:hypothetical protein